MPLNRKPRPPWTGEQLAFRTREFTLSGLHQAKKTTGALRREILAAKAAGKDQDMADALGTADLTALAVAYASLKAFIEACGDRCQPFPALPSTANP